MSSLSPPPSLQDMQTVGHFDGDDYGDNDGDDDSDDDDDIDNNVVEPDGMTRCMAATFSRPRQPTLCWTYLLLLQYDGNYNVHVTLAQLTTLLPHHTLLLLLFMILA